MGSRIETSTLDRAASAVTSEGTLSPSQPDVPDRRPVVLPGWRFEHSSGPHLDDVPPLCRPLASDLRTPTVDSWAVRILHIGAPLLLGLTLPACALTAYSVFRPDYYRYTRIQKPLNAGVFSALLFSCAPSVVAATSAPSNPPVVTNPFSSRKEICSITSSPSALETRCIKELHPGRFTISRKTRNALGFSSHHSLLANIAFSLSYSFTSPPSSTGIDCIDRQSSTSSLTRSRGQNSGNLLPFDGKIIIYIFQKPKREISKSLYRAPAFSGEALGVRGNARLCFVGAFPGAAPGSRHAKDGGDVQGRASAERERGSPLTPLRTTHRLGVGKTCPNKTPLEQVAKRHRFVWFLLFPQGALWR